MPLWITEQGLRKALSELQTLGAHEQTPVFLAMKLAGVSQGTLTSFASNAELRVGFFDRFLALPNRSYFNPFSGTIHNSSYPHGSQYTVARELRKPRWLNSLDWEEPAGRNVSNYNVKFRPGYEQTLKAELFQGRRVPFWPFAIFFQARLGEVNASGALLKDIIDFWGQAFNLNSSEKVNLFDLSITPIGTPWTSPTELKQSMVDQIIRDSARTVVRASSNPATSAPVKNPPPDRDRNDLPLNLIIYGPPGTGKTRELITRYAPLFTDDDGSKRYIFTTFHPSYFYEDFIEGIRPSLADPESPSEIRYEIVDGVFKEACALAESEPTKIHAIFIDEINRGKIDSLFGDIISLLEDDKRDTVSVTLPYSKKPFSVPSNLYIIGTMNTADRSIALLDVALRRRFSFLELPPSSLALQDMLEADGSPGGDVAGVNLPKLLDALNERLEMMLGHDKLIGHGWLVGIFATLLCSKDSPTSCGVFSRRARPYRGGPSR